MMLRVFYLFFKGNRIMTFFKFINTLFTELIIFRQFRFSGAQVIVNIAHPLAVITAFCKFFF